MAEVELQTASALGRQGEPCAGCGAALAADQRYCLNCGQRRGGPRVDFATLLGPAEPPPPSAAEPPAPSSSDEEPARGTDYSPLAAVGGIALLGLMLLVGVLIGRGDGDGGAAPAPQIIRVGQPAAGAVASAPQGGGESGSAKPAKKGGGKGTGTGAKKVNGGLTGSAASKSKGTVQASTDDLNELENQTGEAYQDAIEKLPDKIATPGKPPPIDKGTAPGGGGAAETIE